MLDIDYDILTPKGEWVHDCKRSICILGSTGSIGENTLRVSNAYPNRFEIVALACGKNISLLAQQADKFRPSYLCTQDRESADALRGLLPKGYHPNILYGSAGYAHLASLPEISGVVCAQVGKAGLIGAISAALSGKVLCLANKESLVMAGSLLKYACRLNNGSILPIDSEHNAVYQLIRKRTVGLSRIIITASGGPFRGNDIDFLRTVTPDMALKHPNWRMGRKVTIDSASLMNKGLEVIEACRLFGISPSELGVLVHPQSIVHALAEFEDGSLEAYMGSPDMRMPIATCLLYPDVKDVGVAPLRLYDIGALTFERPDTQLFPCLDLAYRALRTGDDACIVLNAANEVAVESFLNGKISFLNIPKLIEKTLDAFDAIIGDANPSPHFEVPEYLIRANGVADVFARFSVIDSLDIATRKHALMLIESR